MFSTAVERWYQKCNRQSWCVIEESRALRPRNLMGMRSGDSVDDDRAARSMIVSRTVRR